jgi:hypothetical protein
LGISGWVPVDGRLRQVRAASRRNSAPTTILPHAIASDADVLVEAVAWSPST